LESLIRIWSNKGLIAPRQGWDQDACPPEHDFYAHTQFITVASETYVLYPLLMKVYVTLSGQDFSLYSLSVCTCRLS